MVNAAFASADLIHCEFFGSTTYSHLPDSDIDIIACLPHKEQGSKFLDAIISTAGKLNTGMASLGRKSVALKVSASTMTHTVFIHWMQYKIDFAYCVIGGQRHKAIITSERMKEAMAAMGAPATLAARTVVDWAKHVADRCYVDYRGEAVGRRGRLKAIHWYYALPIRIYLVLVILYLYRYLYI